MVNGVLVERTVKEVLPALKTNAEGLKQVLDDLLKQYKAKQTEMENWKVSPHHGLFLFTTEEGCMAHLMHVRNTGIQKQGTCRVCFGYMLISLDLAEEEQRSGGAAMKAML